jgi:hypothetical protein
MAATGAGAGSAVDVGSALPDATPDPTRQQEQAQEHGAATHRATASQPAAAAAQRVDPDYIIEVVESRLLREIERRGGRWRGVF